MKKFLLTLFAVFLFGGAINAQTANCPAGPRFYPDVPTGHWGSTAVSRLSDLGIIIGFPDGLYRGNENLTRYQAALMFFRLIECYFPIIPQNSLSQADLDALRRAIAELTSSLSTVEAHTRANANGIASNAASIAAIETTVTALSGSVASNSQRLDSIAGLYGRIDQLQAAIAGFNIPAVTASGTDIEALQGLQNQLHALKVKADTALARAEKAMAMHGGEVDLTAIEALIRQNKRSIGSLSDLAESLNVDVVNLQERVTLLEGHEHLNHAHEAAAPVAVELSGAQSEIANIREFSLLLRRRQIGLENRVSALEARGTGDIDALTRRVDIIEGKLFEFTGYFRLFYNVRRHTIFDRDANDDPTVGPGGVFRYDHFDVDRIFGEGFLREIPVTGGHSFLSTGTGDDDDEDDFERLTDFNGPREGRVNADLDIGFGFAEGRSGCGFPRKLDCFGGVISLELDQLVGVDSDDDNLEPDPFVYAFNFREAELHYGPIGGSEILKFEFGQDLDIDFTGYVVDTGDSDEDDDEDDEEDLDVFEDLSSGFAAHFDASDYLGAFDPHLTFFYGTDPEVERGNATYAWGGRAGVTALDGDVTISGSVARRAEGASDFQDELNNNLGLTVFGVDGQANFGVFDLDFEFASESLDIGDNVDATRSQEVRENLFGLEDGDSHSLFFAILGIDTSAVKLGDTARLKALEVNYRTIPLGWNGINTDFDTFTGAGDDFEGEEDAGELAEFQYDQEGFGARAAVELFIFDFNAYFDSYDIEAVRAPLPGEDTNFSTVTDASIDTIQTTAFGFEGDINVFKSVAVTGFFRTVTIDDGRGNSEVVDSTEGGNTFTQDSSDEFVPVETTRDDAYYAGREFYDDDHNHYTTGFGVGLRHSGRGKDALIKNLNVDFIFGRINAGFDTTVLNLDADYRLNLGPLALRPYFGFLNTTNDGDEAATNTNRNLSDRTRIQLGTDLRTKPVDVIFKPSLLGAVNYWSTDHDFADTSTANDFTSDVFQFSVGIKLQQFLFKHSSLTLKYGSYSGSNIRVARSPNNNPNPDNNAPDEKAPQDRGGDGVSVDGFEFIWNYYDLELAYGIFNYDPDDSVENDDSQGQAFRIKYKITF